MSIETLDVKTIRRNKGLTQGELADLLKCDIRSIRRYESGDSTPRRIYADALEKIKAGLMDAEIAQVKNRKSENKKVEA